MLRIAVAYVNQTRWLSGIPLLKHVFSISVFLIYTTMCWCGWTIHLNKPSNLINLTTQFLLICWRCSWDTCDKETLVRYRAQIFTELPITLRRWIRTLQQRIICKCSFLPCKCIYQMNSLNRLDSSRKELVTSIGPPHVYLWKTTWWTATVLW